MKIIYLYYPEMFTSIMTKEDIINACKIFEIKYISPILSNHQLLEKIL